MDDRDDLTGPAVVGWIILILVAWAAAVGVGIWAVVELVNWLTSK